MLVMAAAWPPDGGGAPPPTEGSVSPARGRPVVSAACHDVGMVHILRPFSRAVTYTRWLHLFMAVVWPAMWLFVEDKWWIWLLSAGVLGLAGLVPAMRTVEGLQARLLLIDHHHPTVTVTAAGGMRRSSPPRPSPGATGAVRCSGWRPGWRSGSSSRC